MFVSVIHVTSLFLICYCNDDRWYHLLSVVASIRSHNTYNLPSAWNILLLLLLLLPITIVPIDILYLLTYILYNSYYIMLYEE